MTEIWLTRGLPASGKSTWAKQQVKISAGKIIRVNRDDIRSMLGIDVLPYSLELENIILDVQNRTILAAVKAGKDVIVDNTHFEQKGPKQIKRLFDGEIDFKVKDFTSVSVDECIKRDWSRSLDGERSVGEKVIKDIASRMKNAKWKLTEEWMNDVTLSVPYKAVQGAPKAILVDIDGTLARHDSRNPYDYSRVLTDGVHTHIDDLVTMYSNEGYRIILLSGRPNIEDVRNDTKQWLRNNMIPFDYLFMRPDDMLQDNDADVKQFLFDSYIRDYFDIHLMLDDRDRVVRRMRRLEIPVLQVAEGAF